MGTASRAAYEKLKNTTSLRYGDFDVTKDWRMASNPLAGQGGAYSVVFNPNDMNQKFYLGKGEDAELQEYFNIHNGQASLGGEEIGKYFGNDPTGRYDSVFKGEGIQTLAQIAEQKRQAEIVKQFQEGKLTREQVDAAANQEQTAPKSVYQTAYDAAKEAQGAQNETAMSDERIIDRNQIEKSAPQGEVAGAAITTQPVSSYTGGSVVDYLKSVGQASDYASRKALAAQMGIGNYSGTAQQNTQLLTQLRSQGMGSGTAPVVSSAIQGLTSGSQRGSSGGQVGQVGQSDGQVAGVAVGPVQQSNPIKDILSEFGITLDNKSPQTNFADIYEQVYKDNGLADIKKQYESQTKDFQALQDKKSDEALEINNDPWLTEGVRVQRLRKLDEKYELKESNLLNRIKLLESTYNSGREDAQFVAGKIYDQAQTKLAINQDLIMKAIEIAENRAEAAADLDDDILSPTEAATLGVPYGTTASQAAKMGIVPDRYKPTEYIAGLTPQQQQTFLRITDKYQADSIINTGDKALSAISIANQATANPANAGNQLKILYTLVKNLDPDSAVREGDLDLASKTQSYFGKFATSLARIEKGQLLSPEATKLLAQATVELANVWSQAAQRREQKYTSQASVAGIGDAFQEYRGGFSSTGTQQSSGGSGNDLWNW